MKMPFNLLPFLQFAFLFTACTRKADLEKIPDSSLLTLTTIEDARALLDNTIVMCETPSLREVSADDFYLPDSTLDNINPLDKNAYLWQQTIFDKETHADDWLRPYLQVYYTNSIINTLPRLSVKATQQKLN